MPHLKEGLGICSLSVLKMCKFLSLEDNLQQNVIFCCRVNKFISLGANPGKLVVGIPTYGRSFTMSGTNRKPPGVAFSSEGTSGPITQEPGILGYEEICMNIKHSGWTSVDDPNGPYAFKNDQWVGYDTVTSARAKAAYVNANNLGGAMFWQTSTNDFNVSLVKLDDILIINIFFLEPMWGWKLSYHQISLQRDESLPLSMIGVR